MLFWYYPKPYDTKKCSVFWTFKIQIQYWKLNFLGGAEFREYWVVFGVIWPNMSHVLKNAPGPPIPVLLSNSFIVILVFYYNKLDTSRNPSEAAKRKLSPSLRSSKLNTWRFDTGTIDTLHSCVSFFFWPVVRFTNFIEWLLSVLSTCTRTLFLYKELPTNLMRKENKENWENLHHVLP